MRVGLRLGRRVRGQRCAQIAEARHRNYPYPLLRERSRERHTLVVSAAGAVNRQQRYAFADRLVFNRAAGCSDNHTAVCGALACCGDVVVEFPPDSKKAMLKKKKYKLFI